MNERQCNSCREVKPLTLFAYAYKRDGTRRPHTYCKACRSKQQVVARQRKAGRIKTEWKLPEMSLVEQLACLRLRKWAGPVDRERPLVARLAA